MKKPSFQFYPGDWMKDPALRSVSLAARGLWTDMLCLMFESPRRGYLQHATGKPMTLEQLARVTGCQPKMVSRLLQELDDSGVCSRTDHGVIYSRRMVRENKLSELRKECGRLGGNPNLVNQNSNQKVNQDLNHNNNQNLTTMVNQKPTPSSSSSSSSSKSLKPPTPPIPIPDWIPSEDWKDFREHRTKIRKPLTPQGEVRAIRVLEKLRNEGQNIHAVIDQSIVSGWAGLFPIRASNGMSSSKKSLIEQVKEANGLTENFMEDEKEVLDVD